MAVKSSTSLMNSLLEKLRLDDPWVPSRSWDSQTSASSNPSSLPSCAPYPTATVSEASLVRLAMNALQGVESSLISIEKLYALLRHSSADRTSHRIPNLWTRCSSASAVGDLLRSIGQFGCIIFLLRRFVNYFTDPNFDGAREIKDIKLNNSIDEGRHSRHKGSLVNQAFAIAVGRVVDGYISALNTLSASISLRRLSGTSGEGCLSSVGHPEMTLLEVYLHTVGLRTQIESLGNVCNINHISTSFPALSLEDLKIKANSEFNAFPRGGILLSFLYSRLKVTNQDHCTLLKFLFVRSCEPYIAFIRSWIYDGLVSDPYHEFVVECAEELSLYASDDTGIASNSPLPTVRVRDGVVVPCFLEECLIPLCRTGQQLQVIMKLLELCNISGHGEILPCLIGFSSEYPWLTFPITFEKEIIESMVLARASYYKQMMEKIDKISTIFDFSSQQVNSHGVLLILLNNIGNKFNHGMPSITDNILIAPISDGINEIMPHNTVDSDEASSLDEYSYGEKFVESSESPTEDENETEQLIHSVPNPEQNNLFSLDFSLRVPTNNGQNAKSGISSYVEDTQFSNEPKWLGRPEAHVTSCESKIKLFADEDIVGDEDENTWIHSCDVGAIPSFGHSVSGNPASVFFNFIPVSKHQPVHETYISSNALNVHSVNQKYDSTFFSMNPKLNKGSIFKLRSMLGERCRTNNMDSYFEFTSVKDPLKVYSDKLTAHSLPQFCTGLSVTNEDPAASVHDSNHLEDDNGHGMNVQKNTKSCNLTSIIHNHGCDEEHASIPNISGGGVWESLLFRFDNVTSRSIRDHGTKSNVAVEMPLDFVIKSFFLDEILLQYKYLSKLTIKLLIEGFKLNEHFLALRRYHFMELADWADLFIMSLWHRKWYVDDVDKRIPEIQGVLELSVQRSSCEGDPNKDRLYVYLKDNDIVNLSACATGIHSFDYLGLGYRVNWPVTIILTPAALKIYSEIFNFLIQVKLAVFCLSDAWCLLKNYNLGRLIEKGREFSILIETRHKVNHFVSTLQQYVQSQLSQVSWCRFLHSLEHKVEDMLDLELVHMAYLNESLHICFLSNEAQSVATVVQNILQCAMNLRSCLTGNVLEVGSNNEKSTNGYCQIDISQVHSIRKTFDKNLEELYLIYLQSPKHGEIGVSRFWDYLNYNDYYSGVMSKQMGHFTFYS